MRRAAFRAGRDIRDRLRSSMHRIRLPGVRRSLSELPFDYPPSIVIGADVAYLVIGVAACVQRHHYFPTLLPLLALVLLFLSFPLFVYFAIVPSPVQLGLSAVAAAALFFVQPVAADFAPFVLTVAIGEIAAIAPKRMSVLWALAAVAELIVFAELGALLWDDTRLRTGVPMYAMGILLGWLVGVMLQNQRRFLYQEREYQGARAARAAVEERGRIAREVHDVIAHSLSITLLHLTAARHALATDRDVDEAVDALTDAERLGRQAMADIRRTVGLLDTRPSVRGAEPGAGDIGALIDDFVHAGLTVRRRLTGDLGAVSAALGLALYRIGQESLANIAKHAPGAEVDFRLAVGAESVSVRVHNTVPGGLPAGTGGGSGMGIAGMRQRTELLGGRLRAGPDNRGWTVHAKFPLTPAMASGQGGRSRCPWSSRTSDSEHTGPATVDPDTVYSDTVDTARQERR